MTAKKGTRVSQCGICDGTYIANGNGTATCDKNSNHHTTSYGGNYDLTPPIKT